MNLQFGDVASYLNIKPRRTIAEFVQERNQWDAELLNTYLIPHDSGVKVLAAPLKPEDADFINAAHMEKIIKLLRNSFDYIIIDFPQYLTDTILSVLDFSNQIILVLPLELPAVKNVKLCLDLLEALNHKGKIKLVVNRASRIFGVDSQDIEKKIDFIKAEEIPSEGNTVVNATNKGIPFVISNPKAPVSRAVHRIAQLVIEDSGYQTDLKAEKKAAAKTPIIKKLFSR
jgi:pilus assembly protein CpaE